ncbi:MAG TPA: DUF4258 domain-containing protein [Flavisolibacter sp.]|jgi:hypothetical protein|nr:DUF4258 domain-containing protein [Flavisolibacter sp.]
MFKKLAPFLFIILLAILVVVAKRVFVRDDASTTAHNRRVSSTGKQRGFARNVTNLEYTKHSLCRMDCRKVSREDIKLIMAEGTINYRKSDLQDKPCPTYALEGYTDDEEHLRVVFAQCNTITKVVTCINLDEEFACDCPGDERKKKRGQ